MEYELNTESYSPECRVVVGSERKPGSWSSTGDSEVTEG